MKISAGLAELIDSLSDLAALYLTLAGRLEKETNIEKSDCRGQKNTDKTVNRAISFIIENTVLPRMTEPHRQ